MLFDFGYRRALQNASRQSLWLTRFRLSGIPYERTLQGNRFPNSDVLITAALNELGSGVGPAHYVRHELNSGTLVAPYRAPHRSGEPYWLVIPERKWREPRSRAFRA